MRFGGFGVLLAGLALGAAACGTQAAGAGGQNDALTAAVSQTRTQTARVTITTSTRIQGLTTSVTATGVFDFAHSRGMITMKGPVNTTELFLPPKIYIKPPGSAALGLPKGKPWVAFSDAGPGLPAGSGSSSSSSYFFVMSTGPGTGSPGDLLASLTAMSGSEKKLGTAVIRSVPVTGYQVNIDPAKAAARLPGSERASFRQFAATLASGTIPVRVWVDSKHLVRRVQLTLNPLAALKGLAAAAGPPDAKFQVSETTDYYDFGVPVSVPAPPPAQVTDKLPGLPPNWPVPSPGTGSSSAGFSSAPSPAPPRASGTLTAAQQAAAGQAVTAFWAALGRNDAAAAMGTVLPAQRACVQANVSGGPKITVSSFRIVSVEPAGTGRATVRYTVSAKAVIAGHILPGLIPHSVQWLAAVERAGHWYADLSSGTFFAGSCP